MTVSCICLQELHRSDGSKNDKYSIDYVEKYVNGDVVEDINSNNKNNLNDEFTVETTTAFTKDGTDLSFAGYQFMGYYIDSAFQTQIPSLNGFELLAKFPDGNVTIYIKWTPIKETYIIKTHNSTFK